MRYSTPYFVLTCAAFSSFNEGKAQPTPSDEARSEKRHIVLQDNAGLAHKDVVYQFTLVSNEAKY
ncbi:MAG TPA: hypothetical protein VGB77_03120 [Abditibacteriaceae bacterium]|jgi:hypothetical protein